MVDISTLSIVIAAASVVAGVIFAVLQLRNLVKMRKTDLVIRLYSTFGSKEFQEARFKFLNLEFQNYNDYVKRYGPLFSESPAHIATTMVGMFFESAGVLLRRKLIDIDLVEDLLTGATQRAWRKMKPIAEGARKQLNEPRIWEYFEYLNNEMQKREQRLQA